MPISYDDLTGGMKSEHLLVREKCGMFDVSHMGQFVVEGPQAAEFLDFVCTRRASAIALGRAQYCLLLYDHGGIVDDIIVYRQKDQRFLLVVNAANIQKDFAHLQSLAGSYDCALTDESANWALIAVQGPQSLEHLTKIFGSLSDLKYYGFKEQGHHLLSRTGYTGEDGLEIFLPPEEAPVLWERLFSMGVLPIGLGARDTLRLEVGFPLYGHELSDQLYAHETFASFAVNKDSSFLGRQSLEQSPRYVPVALLGDNPKPMRAEEKLFWNDQEVGRLTSGSYSPALKRGMGLGLISTALDLRLLKEESIFMLESGGKRRQAFLTKPPFVETARVKRKVPKVA